MREYISYLIHCDKSVTMEDIHKIISENKSTVKTK